MPDAPPRKRFQIHLSTAIVMMCVAGELMWVNTVEHKGQEYSNGDGLFIRKDYAGTGWPLIYHFRRYDSTKWSYNPYHYSSDTRSNDLDILAAFADAAVALFLIFAVWFLCDWGNRRAARKGA